MRQHDEPTPPYLSGHEGPSPLVTHPLPWRVIQDWDDAYDFQIIDANGDDVTYIASNRGFDNRFLRVAEPLHGKELSYNNVVDIDAALALAEEFRRGPDAAVAILKHTNPCGVGQATSLRQAWEKAFATDRQAPFGGIMAVNQSLDIAAAEAIAEIFSEVIVAPDFEESALGILRKKKNLRLLKTLKSPLAAQPWDVRSVGADSFLMQQRDLQNTAAGKLKIVTRRHPTARFSVTPRVDHSIGVIAMTAATSTIVTRASVRLRQQGTTIPRAGSGAERGERRYGPAELGQADQAPPDGRRPIFARPAAVRPGSRPRGRTRRSGNSPSRRCTAKSARLRSAAGSG